MKEERTYISLTEVVDDYLKSFPPRPKKSKMKHIKQLAYNVIQFRFMELLCIAGIISLVSCLVIMSAWPLTVTIPLPFIGLLVAEQNRFIKNGNKY